MTAHRFPDDFVWGVATSSHQIEGALDADGRGESIWDRYANTPGRISDGSTAAIACDHYRRWRDDIELMRWLGIGAYRFSIAWSRILPTGSGSVNTAGLDFYDGLVDGLLEAGIQPLVTLYHWDLPQAIQDLGGWASRDTVAAFADYTAAVTDRLGDRVSRWVTHNEPWCIATLGHENGHHAPGHTDPGEALRVAHHLLLSHGRAVDVIRAKVLRPEVGIVLNLTPSYPASPSAPDVDAARHFDGMFNRWYLDPLFRGAYPEDAIGDRIAAGQLTDRALPFVEAGDMRVISRPIDFLGVNYYSRVVMAAGENGVPRAVPHLPPDALTDMGWEVYPEGLTDLLLRVQREYSPRKLYITENGAAYSEGPDTSGRIPDERRVKFLRAHVAACHRAIAAGVPLAGYFVWSLLDNFEWSHGFEKRFGLFWVDYDTQVRTPKDSAHRYREIVSAGAVTDEVRQS